MQIDIIYFIAVTIVMLGLYLYITKLHFEQLKVETQIGINDNFKFIAKELLKLVDLLEENQKAHNIHNYKLLEQHLKAEKQDVLEKLDEAKVLIGKLRLTSIDLADALKKRNQLKDL